MQAETKIWDAAKAESILVRANAVLPESPRLNKSPSCRDGTSFYASGRRNWTAHSVKWAGTSFFFRRRFRRVGWHGSGIGHCIRPLLDW